MFNWVNYYCFLPRFLKREYKVNAFLSKMQIFGTLNVRLQGY